MTRPGPSLEVVQEGCVKRMLAWNDLTDFLCAAKVWSAPRP